MVSLEPHMIRIANWICWVIFVPEFWRAQRLEKNEIYYQRLQQETEGLFTLLQLAHCGDFLFDFLSLLADSRYPEWFSIKTWAPMFIKISSWIIKQTDQQLPSFRVLQHNRGLSDGKMSHKIHKIELLQGGRWWCNFSENQINE